MRSVLKRTRAMARRLMPVMLAFGLLVGGVVATQVVASAPALADTGGYPDANATTINASQYEWGYPCGSSCVAGWWAYVGATKYGFLSPRGYAYRNCTDYVAWKLESQGIAPSLVQGRGNGGQWDQSTAGGVTVSTTPVVGDAAVIHHVYSGDPFGHVAYVEAVQVVGGSYQVKVSQYNWGQDGNYSTTGWEWANTYSDFVNFNGGNSLSGGSAPPPPPVSGNITNGSPMDMAGHWWAGDTGQDFAYVEKITDANGNDTGFTVNIMAQTANGLVGHSVWTDNNAGLTYENTMFLPADANGDGLMDLYYITSSNWNANGLQSASCSTLAVD